MQRIAIFDLDGTIVNIQSHYLLIKLLAEKRILNQLDRLKAYLWFSFYRTGLKSSSLQGRQNLYRTLSSINRADIDDLFERCGALLLNNHVRTDIRAAIASHLDQGYRVICLTGAISNIARVITAGLDIPELYSTELVYENGRYSGGWHGDILENSAKAEFAKKLVHKLNVDCAESYCYADSFSDITLMKIFGNPVFVAPDLRARLLNRRFRWPVWD